MASEVEKHLFDPDVVLDLCSHRALDASTIFWNAQEAPDALMGPGRKAQRLRRKKILATARYFIGLHGFNGVSIRMLSDACGMSAQTIHNLLGARKDLLAMAVCEFIHRMMDVAAQHPSGANYFLALSDSYSAALTRNRDYFLSASSAYYLPDFTLFESIRRLIRPRTIQITRTMVRSGVFQERLGSEIFTDQLTAATNGVIRDWIGGVIPDADVRSRLLENYHFLVRAVAEPHAQPDQNDQYLRLAGYA